MLRFPRRGLKRSAGEHPNQRPGKRRCLGIYYIYVPFPIPQPNIRETDEDYILGRDSKRRCPSTRGLSRQQAQERVVINYNMEAVRQQASNVTARLLRDLTFPSSSTFDLPKFINSFMPPRFNIMETLELQWYIHWTRFRGTIIVDENRFDLGLGNVPYSFPNVRRLYVSIQGPAPGVSCRFDPYTVLKRVDRVVRMSYMDECTIALPMCVFALLVKDVSKTKEDEFYYRDLHTLGVWRSTRDGRQVVFDIDPSLDTYARPGKSHFGDGGYLVVGGVQNEDASQSTIFGQDLLALSLGDSFGAW